MPYNRMFGTVRELLPYFVSKKGNNLVSGNLSTTTFVAGNAGWSLNSDGSAEFSDITARGEFHASTFVLDEAVAHNGTSIWSKGTGVLSDAVLTDTTFSMNVDESRSGHIAFASVGDILRIKHWATTSLYDIWCTVTAVNDNDNYFTYDVTKNSGTDTTLPAGSLIVNYGGSGQGQIFLTSNLTGNPYLDVKTQTATPWSAYSKVHVRMGRLDGLSDSSVIGTDEFGIALGTDLMTSGFDKTAAILSNKQATLRNIDFALHNGTYKTAEITAAGAVRFGTNVAGASTTGFYFDSTTGDLLIGQAAGNYVWWDQSAGVISFSGALVAASGTFIGGITGGSTIDIGGADTTSFHVDATGQMWLSHASYASAPFKVSAAGALEATGAIISGALTATSGVISGKLLMEGASSAIAVGTTAPTSASAGTGIWLDRTGLYGLASSVVQAKIDATTGKIVAGASAVTLDVDGVTIEAGTGTANKISWETGGLQKGTVSVYTLSNVNYLFAVAQGTDATDAQGKLYFTASPYNIAHKAARMELTSGITSATFSVLASTHVFSDVTGGTQYVAITANGDLSVNYDIIRTSGSGTQDIGTVGTPFDNLYVNTITASTIIGTLTGSEWETAGNATIDANQASTTTVVYVLNQASGGTANLDVEGSIVVGGTVDGVDVSAHAAATGSSVHGLGTISTQAANSVSISGGTITGITDLAVAEGGTGASDASNIST